MSWMPAIRVLSRRRLGRTEHLRVVVAHHTGSHPRIRECRIPGPLIVRKEEPTQAVSEQASVRARTTQAEAVDVPNQTDGARVRG